MKTRDKRTSEKELAARPSSNKDASLKNQKRAELLRSRIEELDRRLAILNSERNSGFSRSCSTGFVAWTTAVLQIHLRCGNAYGDNRMVVAAVEFVLG